MKRKPTRNRTRTRTLKRKHTRKPTFTNTLTKTRRVGGAALVARLGASLGSKIGSGLTRAAVVTGEKGSQFASLAAQKTAQGASQAASFAAQKTAQGATFAAQKAAEGASLAAQKTAQGASQAASFAAQKTAQGASLAAQKTAQGASFAAQKTAQGAVFAIKKTGNAVTRKMKNAYSAIPSRKDMLTKVKGMAIKTPSAKSMLSSVKAFKPSSLTEMFTHKEPTGNEEPECSYLDMVKYGLLSIFLSPLYVATVIANLPMNTINNLSDNRLKEVEIDALSKQLYKYLFYGYKNGKEIDYTQFVLPDENSIIQDKKVVVGCNTCKKTQKEYRAEHFGQKGGMVGGKVDFNKMIQNSLGILGGKSKLEFSLKDILDYVENIPKLNFERKSDLEHSIRRITDLKMMMRLIVLMNTLFVRNGQDMCENPINLDPNTKTLIDSVHVTRIMNPFASMESFSQKENKFKIDYKETSRCIMKHLLSDSFTGDECRNKCKTCTFQNNIKTLMGNYVRLLSNVFRGTDRGMVTIIQLFFTMLTDFKRKYDPAEKHEVYKVLAESYVSKEKDEFYKELFAVRYEIPVEEFIQDNQENYETFKKIFCDYGLTHAIREHTRNLMEQSLAETNRLKQGSIPYYTTKIRSFFKSNFFFIPV